LWTVRRSASAATWTTEVTLERLLDFDCVRLHCIEARNPWRISFLGNVIDSDQIKKLGYRNLTEVPKVRGLYGLLIGITVTGVRGFNVTRDYTSFES
jgi:hypothetical protein